MTDLAFAKKKHLVLFSRVFLASMIATGCTSGLPQHSKEESFAYQNNQDTKLHQFATSYIKEHQGQTGFYPLGDGQAALIARLALIEMAQKSLDVQYYLYGDDKTSQLLTSYLYQAAERGVRVRLLLDDMQNRNDRELATFSAHQNIEVRFFNPFSNRSIKKLSFIHDFDRVNRRMHNKSITADGSFSIAGGRNIGDEYFSANLEVDFGDFDLLVTGKVVPEIEKQFDLYWNSALAIPIENFVDDIKAPSQAQVAKWQDNQISYLLTSDYTNSLITHPLVHKLATNSLPFYWSREAKLNYDSPYKALGSRHSLLIDSLTLAIQDAKKEFVLVSPYFVPTKKGAELLAQTAKSGVNVTIVTNSLASNDVFAVHGWYAKYRDILLEGGVKLYETKATPNQKIDRSLIKGGRSSLHAKSFIVDTNKVFVGSFNFDPRSMYLNTEMGIFVESPEFAKLFHKNLDSLLNQTSYRLSLNQNDEILWHDDSKNTTFDREPDSSLWLRLGSWIAGVLPIESQL